MKKNKITLKKLFIIILICLVIVVIILHTFNETNKITKLKEYVSKMELIQEKVNLVRNEYKSWENYNPNESGNFISYLQSLNFPNANSSYNVYIDEFNKIIDELNQKNLEDWNTNIDSIITNYCYFNPEDLNKYLGLSDIDLYVIINFYTGNIISKDGVEDSGNIIYRQYDSKIGNKLVLTSIYKNEIKPKLDIIENRGLSQEVKIYFDPLDFDDVSDIAEIYYYSSATDTQKKKCSFLNNYKYIKEEKAAYFSIDTSGQYSFVIEDTNFMQYPPINQEFNLCNPPELLDGMKGIYWDEENIEKEISSEYDSNWYNYSKSDSKMANAKTEDGNYWVWIPRFTYLLTDDVVNVEFVQNKTSISTRNRAMNNYKLHEAFSENGEILGFWMAKFQANIENGVDIDIKPGKALTLLTSSQAENIISSFNKKYSLMSDKEREAVLFLSMSNSIEISNDLVHYAGGAPNEEGFKTNTRYSSTGNIYGVYDLITSENEITSSFNDEGRFRETIR